MRVIAGSHGGRRLKAPPGRATRPTADRVKEALFSIVGPFFSDGVCLDLFAGSGALGIEALSRGCERAVFVDRQTAATIWENVHALDLEDRSSVLQISWERALDRLSSAAERYSLVFIDPPYMTGLLVPCLRRLAAEGLPRHLATVVAETARHLPTPVIPGLELVREAAYGDTKLCVYRYGGGWADGTG